MDRDHQRKLNRDYPLAVLFSQGLQVAAEMRVPREAYASLIHDESAYSQSADIVHIAV